MVRALHSTCAGILVLETVSTFSSYSLKKSMLVTLGVTWFAAAEKDRKGGFNQTGLFTECPAVFLSPSPVRWGQRAWAGPRAKGRRKRASVPGWSIREPAAEAPDGAVTNGQSRQQRGPVGWEEWPLLVCAGNGASERSALLMSRPWNSGINFSQSRSLTYPEKHKGDC